MENTELILTHLAEKMDALLNDVQKLLEGQNQTKGLSEENTRVNHQENDRLTEKIERLEQMVSDKLDDLSVENTTVHQKNYSLFSTGAAFTSLKKTVQFMAILIVIVFLAWLAGDYYSKYGNRKNEEYAAYKAIHTALNSKELNEGSKNYLQNIYTSFIDGDTLLNKTYEKLKIEIDKQQKKRDLENELKKLK